MTLSATQAKTLHTALVGGATAAVTYLSGAFATASQTGALPALKSLAVGVATAFLSRALGAWIAPPAS